MADKFIFLVDRAFGANKTINEENIITFKDIFGKIIVDAGAGKTTETDKIVFE